MNHCDFYLTKDQHEAIIKEIDIAYEKAKDKIICSLLPRVLRDNEHIEKLMFKYPMIFQVYDIIRDHFAISLKHKTLEAPQIKNLLEAKTESDYHFLIELIRTIVNLCVDDKIDKGSFMVIVKKLEEPTKALLKVIINAFNINGYIFQDEIDKREALGECAELLNKHLNEVAFENPIELPDDWHSKWDARYNISGG